MENHNNGVLYHYLADLIEHHKRLHPAGNLRRQRKIVPCDTTTPLTKSHNTRYAGYPS